MFTTNGIPTLQEQKAGDVHDEGALLLRGWRAVYQSQQFGVRPQ
jgi:hypothetical protein